MIKLIDWILRVYGIVDIYNNIKKWWDEQSESDKETLEKELQREKESGKDEKVAFLNIMIRKGIISPSDADRINRLA